MHPAHGIKWTPGGGSSAWLSALSTSLFTDPPEGSQRSPHLLREVASDTLEGGRFSSLIFLPQEESEGSG